MLFLQFLLGVMFSVRQEYWSNDIYISYIYVCSLVIAHAGDGNFHTIILFDPSQEDQRIEAERLNHFMVHTALSMEGSYSLLKYMGSICA
jgi:FAD/FMN-containing dehydrogenase